MAIGMVNNKTTAVRLIPAIGLKEVICWNLAGCSAAPGYARSKSAEKFIARGGRILRRCTASKTKRNMQTYTTDLMIIGGGASGLAAAVAAKQLYPEISVTILERNARVGKKILATGNGRCNLGNTNQDLEHYHGSFAEQCKKIFSDTQSAEIFFQNMGLLSRHETDGRLYPLSNQATSVLDAIRFTAQQLGVSIVCDCDVTALQKSENVLEVKTTQGVYPASAVILAVGGFAAPKTGSDGSAFSWLEQLGHTTVPTKPALVPFYTEPKLVHPLKGIRIPAEVSAVSESGTVLAKDTGEVQFTERTISGICVMNLSARCCKEEPAMLSCAFFPILRLKKLSQFYGNFMAFVQTGNRKTGYPDFFRKRSAYSYFEPQELLHLWKILFIRLHSHS
ncbi:MAG: aminoacetone oxidase family FAD-binding enzyme [Ruminococcus sp.]